MKRQMSCFIFFLRRVAEEPTGSRRLRGDDGWRFCLYWHETATGSGRRPACAPPSAVESCPDVQPSR